MNIEGVKLYKNYETGTINFRKLSYIFSLLYKHVHIEAEHHKKINIKI